MEEKDKINPDHYKSQCSLECIEAMEIIFDVPTVFEFCLCNAWKYIWRHKHKNGTEDLEKARWYINRATYYYKMGEVCPGDGQAAILNRLDNYLLSHDIV